MTSRKVERACSVYHRQSNASIGAEDICAGQQGWRVFSRGETDLVHFVVGTLLCVAYSCLVNKAVINYLFIKILNIMGRMGG